MVSRDRHAAVCRGVAAIVLFVLAGDALADIAVVARRKAQGEPG
jgi:hypothetical protein